MIKNWLAGKILYLMCGDEHAEEFRREHPKWFELFSYLAIWGLFICAGFALCLFFPPLIGYCLIVVVCRCIVSGYDKKHRKPIKANTWVCSACHEANEVTDVYCKSCGKYR